MTEIGREMRQAARRLIRTPAFTLAAALTLALAIGANTAIFAVVQGVLLNPLPYPESNRLIELDHGSARINVGTGLGVTPGLYFEYAERSRTLEGAAVYRTDGVTLTGDGEPERIRIARATPSLAAVLRVSPALGRWFTAEEGAPGGSAAVVLSDSLWRRRYGADPRVVGKPIVLSAAAAEVVGVMPASFAFPDPRVDAWVVEPLSRTNGFGLWSYSGVARMRSGIDLAAARSELLEVIREAPRSFPGDPLALGNLTLGLLFSGRTLKEATIGGVAQRLWILLASVGLVLLIACANVANLFLVRSDVRQREVAVRRALGAGTASIARFFLSESLLLAFAGGLVGVLLAWEAIRLLVALGPATLPRLHEIRLTGMAVAFTCALCLVAAFAFGSIPLWRGAQLAASLHDGGRSHTATRTRHRARSLLMGSQIALALVLLVGSALMVRSFQKLRAVDPGFDASSVLTFSIGLPDREYTTRDAALAAHEAILDRLAALPGVTAASASSCLPLAGGCSGNSLRIEGRAMPERSALPVALFRAVAGGYFETMGIRVIRGRTIDRADVDHREPVAVVTDSLAKRYFPNQDPIGLRVASNRAPARVGEQVELAWLTIVGIVPDTPVRALAETSAVPQLYMPMSIAGGPGIRDPLVGPNISVMNYVVRSTTSPLGLLGSVRRTIDTVDRKLPMAGVRTLQDILDRASAQAAFTMVLIAIAAACALALGIVGIYGVMSYIVSQRTGEIGVRLALGAEPSSVAAMIVRQGAIVTLAGIVVGLAAAFAGSRLIAALLFEVSPHDPTIFATTTIVLLAVALFACWLPARRAARLSPLEALRTD